MSDEATVWAAAYAAWVGCLQNRANIPYAKYHEAAARHADEAVNSFNLSMVSR